MVQVQSHTIEQFTDAEKDRLAAWGLDAEFGLECGLSETAPTSPVDWYLREIEARFAVQPRSLPAEPRGKTARLGQLAMILGMSAFCWMPVAVFAAWFLRSLV